MTEKKTDFDRKLGKLAVFVINLLVTFFLAMWCSMLLSLAIGEKTIKPTMFLAVFIIICLIFLKIKVYQAVSKSLLRTKS